MRFTKAIEIKNYILIVCLSLFMLFFTSTSYANWAIYKQAQIRNSQKYNLRFSSSNEKVIQVWFILKGNNKGVFSSKLPVYRIDNNDIHKILKGKAYKGIKIKKGRWIRWVISDGEEPSKALKEFINGKEVVFQYHREDGKIMETIFSLEGIKDAVEELL